MSGSHRQRRSRVQGGWATSSSRSGRPTQMCRGSTQPVSTHGQFLYQDDTQFKVFHTAPENFSWVIKDVLAGCGFPRSRGHLQFLVDQGVHILVTLTEKTPPTHAFQGLKCFHFPVRNYNPPSQKQIQEFVTLVQKARQENKAVAVHCLHGRGRSGTFLACYLVHDKQMEAEEAIREIRRLRPRSIETYQQEQVVHQYATQLKTSMASTEQT